MSYAPFTLNFCPLKCRTRQISKLTCAWRTETVTNCCYVNRQTGVFIINKYQTASTSFDLMTDRLMPSVTDWMLIMYSILVTATSFSLLQELCCVQSITGFLYGWCKHYFVSELNNEYFTRQIYKTVFWVAKSYRAVCFNYFLSTAIFWT